MGKERKDPKGNVLRKGEVYRKVKNIYSYVYNEDGKKKYLYSSDLNKLRIKEESLTKMTDNVKTDLGDITFDDMFCRYILCSLLRSTTKENQHFYYDTYLKEFFGQKNIRSIRYSEIKMFFNTLSQKLRSGSLEVINAVMNNVFETAVKDDVLEKNPVRGIIKEIKKSKGYDKTEVHALTKNERDIFFSVLKDSKYYLFYPFFVFLLGTGCRFSEAIGLTWKDVDLENRNLSINHSCVYHNHGYDERTLKRKSAYWTISPTKSHSGMRDIPIFDEVYKALLLQNEYRMKYGDSISVVDGVSDFVFVNRCRKIFNGINANAIINKVLMIANSDGDVVRHFSCHSLRHTFCSILYEKDVSLKIIQELMGHSDASVTMNVYTEVEELRKKDLYRKINQDIRFMSGL